jgi:hypothetical protein
MLKVIDTENTRGFRRGRGTSEESSARRKRTPAFRSRSRTSTPARPAGSRAAIGRRWLHPRREGRDGHAHDGGEDQRIPRAAARRHLYSSLARTRRSPHRRRPLVLLLVTVPSTRQAHERCAGRLLLRRAQLRSLVDEKASACGRSGVNKEPGSPARGICRSGAWRTRRTRTRRVTCTALRRTVPSRRNTSTSSRKDAAK